MFTHHVYLIYKSKQDLSLKNLLCLIWQETKPTYEELFLHFTEYKQKVYCLK